MKTRVLIVDDEPIAAPRYPSLSGRTRSGIEVVGESGERRYARWSRSMSFILTSFFSTC